MRGNGYWDEESGVGGEQARSRVRNEGQGDEQGAKREMVGVAEAEAVATTERLDQV